MCGVRSIQKDLNKIEMPIVLSENFDQTRPLLKHQRPSAKCENKMIDDFKMVILIIE